MCVQAPQLSDPAMRDGEEERGVGIDQGILENQKRHPRGLPEPISCYSYSFHHLLSHVTTLEKS